MFPHENSVSLLGFTTCSLKRFISCNSVNSVEAVIIIGTTCILCQNNILDVFLRCLLYYKHCFAMKALSGVVFSVFVYLGSLGWLQRKKYLVQYKLHGNEWNSLRNHV